MLLLNALLQAKNNGGHQTIKQRVYACFRFPCGKHRRPICSGWPDEKGSPYAGRVGFLRNRES